MTWLSASRAPTRLLMSNQAAKCQAIKSSPWLVSNRWDVSGMCLGCVWTWKTLSVPVCLGLLDCVWPWADLSPRCRGSRRLDLLLDTSQTHPRHCLVWGVSGVCLRMCLGCVWAWHTGLWWVWGVSGMCLECVSGLSGFSLAAVWLLFRCSLAARPAGLGSVRDEN